eukprot:6027985-Alexandrium_andersonii.AAC.1
MAQERGWAVVGGGGRGRQGPTAVALALASESLIRAGARPSEEQTARRPNGHEPGARHQRRPPCDAPPTA